MVFGSSLPLSPKRNGQSWTPLTKPSGSAHAAGQLCFMCEVRFHAPRPPHAAQLLKQQQQVAWKRQLWSWTSCCPWDFDYAPLSAADNISRQVGPQIRPDKMFNVLFITNVLIRMCGRQADLLLCWSHTTKSGCVGRFLQMITAFIKMDGNFLWKKLNGRKIHPYWETFPSKKTYGLTAESRDTCGGK